MKKLFYIAACLLIGALTTSPLFAATVPLSSTWSEYDLDQILNGGLGNVQLSAQSSSGFTATIKTNAVDVNPADGAADSQGRPRIYQEFQAVPFANTGSVARLSFDLILNNAVAVQDTGFRFGLVVTNQGVDVGTGITGQIDLGTPGSPTVRLRHDNDGTSVTNVGTGALYTPGDWSDFADANSTLGSTSTLLVPNGVGLVNTTTTHSFKLVIQRTTGGLREFIVWTNNATPGANPTVIVLSGNGGAVINPLADPVQKWDSIGAVGFWCNNNDMFIGTGSYTVSNLKITYGYDVTAVRDSGTGNVTLTWESFPSATVGVGSGTIQYTVQSSADLNTWTNLALVTSATSPALTTQYTDTTASSAAVRFYRIRGE